MTPAEIEKLCDRALELERQKLSISPQDVIELARQLKLAMQRIEKLRGAVEEIMDGDHDGHYLTASMALEADDEMAGGK